MAKRRNAQTTAAKADRTTTAPAPAAQQTTAQTADQERTFADLIRAYEQDTATGADTTDSLLALAQAVALSVVAKCIDPQRKAAATRETVSNGGQNPALLEVRRGIMADIALLDNTTTAHNAAYGWKFNKDGYIVSEVVDKAAEKAAAALMEETLSEGVDLVNAAVVAILEQTEEHAHEPTKAELAELADVIISRTWSDALSRGDATKQAELSLLHDAVMDGIWTNNWDAKAINDRLGLNGLHIPGGWMEMPYTARRLSRRVMVRADDSAKWEDVETTPISEVYRAVRREVQNSRAMQTDPRNGYSYIEDTAADPDSNATETIYRRLHKWADLGGYTMTGHYDEHGNASRGGQYTTSAAAVADYEKTLAALNLTARQSTIIKLRMSGHGYKAIATYLGVTQAAVNIQLYRIREKCEKIGFTPAMWAEMTAEK